MIPAAHINETLKRMLPVMAKTNESRLAQVLQTPYLTFTDSEHKGITQQELAAVNLVDDHGLVRTPFPCFRFCMSDYKGRIVCGCVQRQEDNLSLVAFHRYEGKVGPVAWAIIFKRWSQDGDMEFDGRLFDTRTMKDVTEFMQKLEQATPDNVSPKDLTRDEANKMISKLKGQVGDIETSCEILRGQKELLESLIDISKGGQTPFPKPVFSSQTAVFIALYHSVMVLCYEYLAPHNFTARVTPATQGKSVEWLRAREHYTVIHRHHTANNAAIREGQTVNDANNTTRLAHSRRAHTKVLNHPRYKFKRGQTIFVRASWVGPKEWKDTAGQTYQILTEVAA